MPRAGVKKSKYIFLLLRTAVVVTGIVWAAVWVSREQRWSKLAEIFLRVNVGVFAGTLGIYIVGQIIIALRWCLLLRTQSILIGAFPAIRLHFLGLFYNNFLPSSIGGDLIRAWYVTKHTDKKIEAALSVFIDRAIGLLSMIILATCSWFLFLHGGKTELKWEYHINLGQYMTEHKEGILLGVAILIVLVCLLLIHHKSRYLLGQSLSKIKLYGTHLLVKVRNAIVVYSKKPFAILCVLVLTFISQSIVITGFWLLGLNMEMSASVKYFFVFFPASWVLGTLPISIGGAVVVEGWLVLLFTQVAGVGAEEALALALCQRIIWMLASLPGAAIHLVGAHLPKDFFIDYDEPEN